MSDIIELFGIKATSNANWKEIVSKQICPYLESKCYKVRKSQPEIAIGTCTVRYGKSGDPVIICPTRLLEKRKVFMDCIHLLSLHEPGNELHVVSEISVPGGSIDFIVASVKDKKVKDFVGVEFQTMDTTGTVWPARQTFLQSKGLFLSDHVEEKSYGMNWKMTAKTILMQMHHKVETFENLGKHLVLVVQDHFMDYMKKEFSFREINEPALIGDSVHFHSYSLEEKNDLQLKLKYRTSTDSDGIAKCIGLQAEAKMELSEIFAEIEVKLNDKTLIRI
jgi:hypothetical protein